MLRIPSAAGKCRRDPGRHLGFRRFDSFASLHKQAIASIMKTFTQDEVVTLTILAAGAIAATVTILAPAFTCIIVPALCIAGGIIGGIFYDRRNA